MGDAMVALMIGLIIILCAGTPDLLDAIIDYVNAKAVCVP